jgi:hypothetical protein
VNVMAKSSGTRTCVRSDDQPKARQAGTPAATRPSRLWLWFVAAFVLQAAAWTAWFTIASKHRVEEVPLVTRSSDR